MKRILVIADGPVATEFVKRIVNTHSDENVYDIVYYNEGLSDLPDAIHCRFFRFDPTSFKKLEKLFVHPYSAAFLVMADPQDVTITYENLRALARELPISILDQWELTLKEDPHLDRIGAKELLANRMMALVPNIPVAAQYVGLGTGEIIEAQVPFGSGYAYRHISNIEQKKWKIAAVYRNRALVLPRPSLMVRPGDTLLLVGQPSILKNVYKAIKIETGQFPYGRNIYLLLDLSRHNRQRASWDLEAALNLHRRIKNKILFIRVINPDDWALLERLRSLRSFDVVVEVAYKGFNPAVELGSEINRLNAGLVVVGPHFFKKESYRRILYKTRRPVLKLGRSPLSQLESASLMLSGNPNLEHISAPIFDLCGQMALPISLVLADSVPEAEEAVLEHYENLAAIHSKTLDIQRGAGNPIRLLKSATDRLLFYPFEAPLIRRSWLDLFRVKEVEKLYPMLDHHHQLFIPVL